MLLGQRLKIVLYTNIVEARRRQRDTEVALLLPLVTEPRHVRTGPDGRLGCHTVGEYIAGKSKEHPEIASFSTLFLLIRHFNNPCW